jgi:glycerophosphoryl diester phosphodiesterase
MPIIVGHRGAKNLWPENSLSGFRRTVALGVPAVEFDVHQSRDGELIVIHDATLDRTTHGTGPVTAQTAAALTSIRLRDTDGETVPKLAAVLDVLGPAGIEMHVEIKTDALGNPYPGLEAKVIAALQQRGLLERSIVTCFVPDVLKKVRRLAPEVRVLASLDRRSAEMMGGISRALARLGTIPGALLAVEKSLLKLCLPACLASFGADRLAVWVPNEKDELDEWLAAPIRAITTDRPDIALGKPAAP